MAGYGRKKVGTAAVFPGVLYPGNMNALEACFVFGQLPKHRSGSKTGPRVSFKTLTANGGGLQCSVVYHYVFDPLTLGEAWDTKPHVWLLCKCEQKGKKWHFHLKAQVDMTVSDSNAQWPVLIEGGSHILWRPNKVAEVSELLRVHPNGTVVPNNPT